MNEHIFLSYSSLDVSWVEQVAIGLEQKGIDVWFSYNNIQGEEFASDRIQAELRKSQIIIVFLSQNSIHNPYVFFELGAAVAGNKKIIPVVMDDMAAKEMPLPLIKYHYLKVKYPSEAARKIADMIGNEESRE